MPRTQRQQASAAREATEGFRPAEYSTNQLIRMQKMAKKAAPPAGKRTRVVVDHAGLVGVNWDTKKVSGSVYLQSLKLCHDLSYWLNRRIASVIGPAKPNGEGWTHLVCWPGRGMFVVKLRTEEVV